MAKDDKTRRISIGTIISPVGFTAMERDVGVVTGVIPSEIDINQSSDGKLFTNLAKAAAAAGAHAVHTMLQQPSRPLTAQDRAAQRRRDAYEKQLAAANAFILDLVLEDLLTRKEAHQILKVGQEVTTGNLRATAAQAMMDKLLEIKPDNQDIKDRVRNLRGGRSIAHAPQDN